jgi:hypothetical protein
MEGTTRCGELGLKKKQQKTKKNKNTKEISKLTNLE